jgi:hypothetical protein
MKVKKRHALEFMSKQEFYQREKKHYDSYKKGFRRKYKKI